MGKQARQAGRAHRGRRLQSQIRAAEVVKAAWRTAWADYARTINDITRGQLARQGRKLIGVGVTPEEHHQARERYVDGTAGPITVKWPSYTYIPRSMLNGWLLGTYGWERSRELADLTMPIAQIGAALAAFDAAPVVARFDPDVAAAIVATPITGDLPVELIRRMPTWTIAIPMPWAGPDDLVAFVTLDSTAATLDGLFIDDVGLDQLLIMYVAGDVIAPTPIELGAGSISDQLVRNNLAGVPDAPPMLIPQVALDEGRAVLGINMEIGELVQQTMALILYLCSEEPDTVSVRTPVPVRPPSPTVRGAAPPPPMDVVDVGYRIGAALRAAASAGGSPSDGDATGLRRRPVAHLRRAHFQVYWYGPRANPAARTPKVRWVAPVAVNLDTGAMTLTIRDVEPDASGTQDDTTATE